MAAFDFQSSGTFPFPSFKNSSEFIPFLPPPTPMLPDPQVDARSAFKSSSDMWPFKGSTDGLPLPLPDGIPSFKSSTDLLPFKNSSDLIPFPWAREEEDPRFRQAQQNANVSQRLGTHQALYSCLSSSSIKAIASWNLETKELLGFSDGFSQAIAFSSATLQKGFKWPELFSGSADEETQQRLQQSEQCLQEVVHYARTGQFPYSKIHITMMCGSGAPKQFSLSVLVVNDEVVWLLQEDALSPSGSPRPYRESLRGSPTASPSTSVRSGRKKTKPWDSQVVKFSLKNKIKRSKSSK